MLSKFQELQLKNKNNDNKSENETVKFNEANEQEMLEKCEMKITYERQKTEIKWNKMK